MNIFSISRTERYKDHISQELLWQYFQPYGESSPKYSTIQKKGKSRNVNKDGVTTLITLFKPLNPDMSEVTQSLDISSELINSFLLKLACVM